MNGFSFGYIAFDLAAAFIELGLIGAFTTGKKVKGLQQRVFYVFLVFSVISALSSVLSYSISMNFIYVRNIALKRNLVAFFKMLFYIGQMTISPTFMVYVQIVNGVIGSLPRKFHVLSMVPFLISVAVIFTAPISKVVFTVDNEGIYHRGPFVIVVFIACAFYVVGALISFFRYRRAIPENQIKPILLACLLTLIAAIIQLAYQPARTQLLGQALTFFWIYLYVEAVGDEYDTLTGAYNRQKFYQEIQRKEVSKQHYGILNVRLTNLQANLKLFDAMDVEAFMHGLAQKLQAMDLRSQLFSCESGEFVFLTRHEDMAGFQHLVEQVQNLFYEDFEFQGRKMSLHVVISGGFYPEQITDIKDVTHLVLTDYGNPLIAVETIVGDDLQVLRRGTIIEEKLLDALENHTFEVWYQPIWDREKNQIVAAEALSRFIDDELGFISPDEFIPIAEEVGLIGKIGEYVLEEVCSFIASEEFKKTNLSYIGVNLSEYQVNEENLTTNFLECLAKYHVSPKQIHLELTESSIFQGTPQAIRSMDSLRTAGFMFSIDDFGTGYSNLSKLMHAEFANVKIDKSLLWDADTDLHRDFLKVIVQTAHMMHVSVVQEGVETEEQLEFMKSIGADMVQGYYFSKPVAAKEFVNFVTRFNSRSTVS